MLMYSLRTKQACSSMLLSKLDCSDTGELVPTEGKSLVEIVSGMFPAQAAVRMSKTAQLKQPSHIYCITRQATFSRDMTFFAHMR